jgi:hypothetical protein
LIAEGLAQGPGDDGQGPLSRAAIFVADPSAEAERIAQALRGAGYLAVDVPTSMLVARVAVQMPIVLIMDADAAGVAEAVARIRGVAGGAGIHILFLGESSTAVPESERAAAAFFARPVDAADVVRKVDALTGGPSVNQGSRMTSGGAADPLTPADLRPVGELGHAATSSSSSAPPGAPVSVRPSPGSTPPREAPLSARSGRRSVSIQAPLCSELEALLADAELRVGTLMAQDLLPPTPEEEIEAVLPTAMLAALDEPLEEDEDAFAIDPPPSRPNAGVSDGTPAAVDGTPAAPRVVTNAGRGTASSHPPGPSPEDVGIAPTLAAPPTGAGTGTGAGAQPDLPPPALSHDLGREPSEASLTRPTDLGPADAPRLLAEAIATHTSGCFRFESEAAVRHVVLRDGDVVTTASSADTETLLAFLTMRGNLRPDQVKDHAGKLPAHGRHAGAAFVAHGLLHQDELWSTLRAHAEWVLGRTLLLASGTMHVEAEAPGRLRQEPGVFGGSSGAEVLVEVTRRVISPEEALRRLGGPAATVTEGPSALLSECALGTQERTQILAARGSTVEELMHGAAGAEMACVVYALWLLGVVVVATSAGRAKAEGTDGAGVDALDVAALRDRVRARLELVNEADYFALLGVARDATGYEIRRAYLDLRRAFEPSRILTPETVDLEGDVGTIVLVLDEAYEILKDTGRRERYRRALGDMP